MPVCPKYSVLLSVRVMMKLPSTNAVYYLVGVFQWVDHMQLRSNDRSANACICISNCSDFCNGFECFDAAQILGSLK